MRGRALLAGASLAAFLPLAYLLYDLLQFRNDMSSWVAMRLAGAGLLMREQKLYVDFWDWSQPLVFDSLKLVLILREGLEKVGCFVPADRAVQVAVWLLLVLSCALTIFIAERALRQLELVTQAGAIDEAAEVGDQLRLLIVPLVLAQSLTALICRFDFGDLPHLLIMALGPWTLMRWLAYRGVVLSPWLGMPVGVLAGLAACLDLPFALFFVAVEIVLALDRGSARPVLSLDCLAFVLTCGVYVCHLLQLDEPSYTAFWKWTMPLKWANYSIYDGSLYGTDSCPDRRDVLYGMALALALAFTAGRKQSFMLPMVAISLAGFSLYILEKQGFSRDLIPTIYADLFCVSLTIFILVRYAVGRFLPAAEVERGLKMRLPALGLAVLALTACVGAALNSDRDRMHDYVSHLSDTSYDDLLTVYNNLQIWKNPVMVISDYPGAAYPAVVSLGAEPCGYLLWARPLRLLDWLKHHQLLDERLKDFYNHVCQKVGADLRSKAAATVIVEGSELEMLANAGLLPQLEGNYKKGEECRYYSTNRAPREFVGHWYFEQFARRSE